MFKNKYWLKYFPPLALILFCPVTIVFLWSIYYVPVVDFTIDNVEDVKF